MMPEFLDISSHDEQARGVMSLTRRLAALKAVPRTGWLDRNIAPELVESVADHSFGVAVLAWACALARQREGANLDPARVLALALVHDLAEADTGDVPPYDPDAVPAVDDPEARRAFLDRRHIRDETRDATKRAAEDVAMRTLLGSLPPTVRSTLSEIWEELQSGTSDEARFVKQVDRLETFLQARHYQRDDPNIPVESFRREVMETIDDPLLQAIRDAALADVRDQKDG